MVSFQCDGCGDVVKKPKLNQHGNRCYATFTCIDCSTTFQGTSYQSHNSCMTEAEKFQKHIYQNKNAPVKGKEQPKTAPKTAPKPVSIVEQLNEKKRKSEEEENAKTTEKVVEQPKEKKQKRSEWSSTKLSKDTSEVLELALKEVLKDGKTHSLKDTRTKTIELIKNHPKYKKFDIKKSFDEKFTLTLKDNTFTFA